MSLAETTINQTLSCILLPLSGYDALLPNSIVKEVVFKPNIQFSEDDSDWLIGKTDWQDHVLPLISFELLCNQSRVKKSESLRAVICCAMGDNDVFPYYALEVQSMPRPLILDSRALHNNTGMTSRHSEVISHHVKIGSKELAIPNFEKLEAILATRAN